MTHLPLPSSFLSRRLAVLLLILAGSIASCNYFQLKEDHLPADKMRDILLDINIAETYSSMVKDSLRKPGVKSPDSLASFYRIIFDRHHITRGAFDTSLAWYKLHPTEFDSLLGSMIPPATRWRDSAK